MKIIIFILLFIVAASNTNAQQNNMLQSQQMRMGDTFIRVAEPGQFSDTVGVWGDVSTPGNYIIPKGTSVMKLLNYSRGPSRVNTSETVLDWSQLRYQVHVSKNKRNNLNSKSYYNFVVQNNAEVPDELRTVIIENGDVMIVEVRRKPAFIDYVRVVAPILTAVSTTILIFINFSRL